MSKNLSRWQKSLKNGKVAGCKAGNLSLALLLIASITVLFALPRQTQAFTSEKDTMSRLKISQAANHTIQFSLNTGQTWAAGETLIIDFADAFGTTGFINTDPLDYDISWGGTDKSIVANGFCVANSIEITTVNTATDTFTFTLCPASSSSAPGAEIIVEIGIPPLVTFGGNGDTQITNPPSAGSNLINLSGTIQGTATGQLAVGITAEDQVTVTASVDASLTFTVTNTSINLGTLSISSVSSNSTNTLVVTTNAQSGYIITGLGDNTNGMVNQDISGQYLNWVIDGTVTAGSEEFGAAYAGAAGHPVGDVGLGTLTTVTSRISPQNNDTTTVTYKASIDTLTQTGSYRSIITYIATGTF